MSLQRRFDRALKAVGVCCDVSAAIALSGGPDSLALAILASNWLHRERSVSKISSSAPRWTAMVVDHGLKAEASAEAATAAQQAGELGFETVLLQAAWPDGHPEKGRIMEAARQMRYRLLETKCIELNISWLMTAHHADDQAESGLIRLVRASGIHGLQGILPSRPFFNARPGKSTGRIVRPLLGMHKDELVALCQSEGLPFALDQTNQDTYFSRNHLRKLMGGQQAIAACMLQEVSGCSPSREAIELASRCSAAQASKSDVDLPQRVRDGASCSTDPGQHTLSRAPTTDMLRVMAACSAASEKLQKDADLVLEQARLQGPSTLLDIETLRRSSKHVAVRALSKALVGVTCRGTDAHAVHVMPHKAAKQLWMALQPGRQPHAFIRGGSIECHLPGAPCPMISAAIVKWPKAGCAARQSKPTRQALLLRPQSKRSEQAPANALVSRPVKVRD